MQSSGNEDTLVLYSFAAFHYRSTAAIVAASSGYKRTVVVRPFADIK